MMFLKQESLISTTASVVSTYKNNIATYKERMLTQGVDFTEIDIEKTHGAALRSIMNGHNCIWMEGGNTFYLLRAMKERSTDRLIKEFIERGSPYIGTSAGTYVACPTIEVATWKKPGKEKNMFGVTDFSAMNMVPFLIKAHYEDEKRDIVKSGVSRAAYPVRILKDGQAIVVRGDSYEFLGGKEVEL